MVYFCDEELLPCRCGWLLGTRRCFSVAPVCKGCVKLDIRASSKGSGWSAGGIWGAAGEPPRGSLPVSHLLQDGVIVNRFGAARLGKACWEKQSRIPPCSLVCTAPWAASAAEPETKLVAAFGCCWLLPLPTPGSLPCIPIVAGPRVDAHPGSGRRMSLFPD